MTATNHRQLWAKSNPHHLLWRHLLDVAAVAEALWPRFEPLEDVPRAWITYLCALHDIGKADPWFQNKDNDLALKLNNAAFDLPERSDLTDKNRLYFRHEARSSEWIGEELTEKHGWGNRAAKVIAAAINGHHGDFLAVGYDESELPMQCAFWEPLRAALASDVWDVLQPPPYQPQQFENASTLGVALSGLLIVADWIASNADIYPYETLNAHEEPRDYFAAARKLAAEVVNELGFVTAQRFASPPTFATAWPTMEKPARPSQRAIESAVLAETIAPGLAILEAPMGEGKTEAAIYLADCWNALRGTHGIYLALPTQATSNQIHGRFAEYLKTHGAADAPRLVHGMAWLLDEKTPQNGAQTWGEDSANERDLSREWFRPLRRALLASDGVGTVDQAMMAALHVKFGVLRLLGLRGKVLVIDEVHAYDAYMTTILEHLLRWCRALDVPVILLSATLSQVQKQKLVAAYGGDAEKIAADAPYPLLTTVAGGATSTVEIDRTPKPPLQIAFHDNALNEIEAIARLALQRIAAGGCACVLMNTVKGAQDVFAVVGELLKTEEFARPDVVRLFHARFRASERKKIEEEITRVFGKDATLADGTRPRRALLIATQVVEQSLDVDFDYFLTQCAPIDLLLQRSGRLWRHARPADRPVGETGPTLDILMPRAGEWQFGATEKVYARAVLLRTVAALHNRTKIELPAKFRCLIEAVYSEEIPDGIVPRADIEAATEELGKKQKNEVAAANISLLPPPNPRAFEWTKEGKKEADEGAAKDYLHASTRLGNDSRAALVLNDAAQIERAKSSRDEKSRAPKHEDLRALFGNKVNLPAWWLRETKPADSFDELFEGAHWLRGVVIVPLKDGVWRNCKGDEIRDNAWLGLLWIPANKEDEEEADAARTN